MVKPSIVVIPECMRYSLLKFDVLGLIDDCTHI